MNATTLVESTSTPADNRDILGRLRSCLPAGAGGISAETPIALLPLDSIDQVEFLCALEAEFNMSLTLEEFASLKTAGDLSVLIDRKASNRV